jgi:hypothetical protein
MSRRVLGLIFVLLASSCGSSSKVVDILSSTPGSSPSATMSVTTSPSISGGSGAGRAIVVKTPRPGDEITSPVTVSGTADVAGVVVSIRVLDADGQELAAMAAQASCGTGCRGRFSATLAFLTQERQAGFVEVFGANGEGGPPASLVEIPVRLVPGA